MTFSPLWSTGGYLNAQMDIAKKLLSRGMGMVEVADVVGLDEDDLEENFGELITGHIG